ncbi:MAG: glycosyltransferase family 2 protein [Microthrixaceae bacterium]|nr:glycosyltransferase family 2 protein [Microthrixaceae bacterium]
MAFVLAVRNEEADLAATVASIRSQRGGTGPLAIAVAPSDDDTWGVARVLAADDPQITVVENPAGWVSHGLNRAIAATREEFVVRVDGHCTLPPDYTSLAVEALDRTGADVVGGIQSAEGASGTQQAVAVAMSSRLGVGNSRFHYGGAEGHSDTVYLGVFRRSALERVGGFDETLLRNQDYELNWRIRDTGGEVWLVPSMVVTYRPRPSLRALASQYRQYGTWKRVMLGRHPRSLKLRQLVAPVMVAGVTVTTATGAWTEDPRWLVPGVGYAAAVTVGGWAAGRGTPPATRLRVPAALAVMHWAWGLGFLFGRPVPPPH